MRKYTYNKDKKKRITVYPDLVAGRVKPDEKAIVQTVREKKRWTESQLIRALVCLDADALEAMKEAWREQG